VTDHGCQHGYKLVQIASSGRLKGTNEVTVIRKINFFSFVYSLQEENKGNRFTAFQLKGLDKRNLRGGSNVFWKTGGRENEEYKP
jgi:hypothetical protein